MTEKLPFKKRVKNREQWSSFVYLDAESCCGLWSICWYLALCPVSSSYDSSEI